MAQYLKIIIIQSLILKVLASSLHPQTMAAVSKYLQLGLPPTAPSRSPTVGLPAKHFLPPDFPSIAGLNLPNSPPGISIISGLPPRLPVIPASPPGVPIVPSLPPGISTVPLPTTSPPVSSSHAPKSSKPANVDSTVLNNLAIALQLLIVSNILNSPVTENSNSDFMSPSLSSAPDSNVLTPVPVTPLPVSYSVIQSQNLVAPPQPYSSPPCYHHNPVQYEYKGSYLPPSLPNANFLGSSNFVNSMSSFMPGAGNFGPKPLKSRSNINLMSPYDALKPDSPYQDPILSSAYGFSGSKKDFQSPYSAISSFDSHKDLFSMTDVF